MRFLFSIRFAPVAVAGLMSLACGGSSDNSSPTTTTVADPVITAFSAAATTVAQGGSTTLTASFTDGTGIVTSSVGDAVGAVTSGVAVTVTPSATTTYTLTVTNTSGKTATKTVTVTVVAAPDATITTSASTVVLGNTFTASVPEQTDATYAWTVTGGTASSSTTPSITVTPSATGTVTVSCIVTLAGATATDSKSVTVTAAQVGPDSTVTTSASTMTYGSTFTASVPTQPTSSTFVWTVTGGTITAETTTTTTSSITVAARTFADTSVKVSCVVTDADSLSSTSASTVKVTHASSATLSVFKAGSTDLLLGQTTTLTGVFSGGTAVVDPHVGAVTSDTPVTITPPSGNSIYYIKVTNSEGSPVFASVSILAREPIAAIDAPSFVPVGGSFTASVPEQYVSSAANYSYAWSVTGGTLDSGDGTRTVNVTASAAKGESVVLSCVISNGVGGQGTGTRTVPVATADDPYTWPSYSPDLNYSFKDEYPDLDPTKFTVRPDNNTKVTWEKTSDWWVFRAGKTANALVTSAAVDSLLLKLNTDFAYGRSHMGWPPDKGPKRGYYSAVHLHGSSLSDSDANTLKGGWMESLNWKNEDWAFIGLTYYPIATFDPAYTGTDAVYQQNACVHEGLHAVFADLPGSKASAWYQEGGIVSLQGLMEADRSGAKPETTGWLDGAQFLAPHTPIECYSGWLQDGSFGGPSAEGVNQYDSAGKQICTWRKYLGGGAYGTAFPRYAAECVSPGIIMWIMKNATGRVVAGIGDGLGETQTRRMVMEYKARQALVDFPISDVAFKAVISDWVGASVGAEGNTASGVNLVPDLAPFFMTPYAMSTFDSTTRVLTPAALTLPGWSGGNQIPLAVTSGATTVSFDFAPTDNYDATTKNMTCQIAYRAEDGTAVYSQPVYGPGTCGITFPTGKAPKDGVVIAVISNTDYIYTGDAIRWLKYNYTLTLGDGLDGKAPIAQDETAAGSATSTTNKYYLYY